VASPSPRLQSFFTSLLRGWWRNISTTTCICPATEQSLKVGKRCTPCLGCLAAWVAWTACTSRGTTAMHRVCRLAKGRITFRRWSTTSHAIMPAVLYLCTALSRVPKTTKTLLGRTLLSGGEISQHVRELRVPNVRPYESFIHYGRCTALSRVPKTTKTLLERTLSSGR